MPFDFDDVNQLSCCGALEISGFPDKLDNANDDFWYELIEWEAGGDNYYDQVAKKRPTKQQMLSYVEESLRHAIETARPNRPYSHVIVTLLDDQKKIWNAMLKRNGFKMVGGAVNGNTGNRVWMYVRLRPEKERKPVKKKRGHWGY